MLKQEQIFEMIETMKKQAIKELVKDDILDKIRTDINNLTVYYTTKAKGTGLISQKAVNRVIDKYKKECKKNEF